MRDICCLIKKIIILLYIPHILMVMGPFLTYYDLKNKLDLGKKVNGRFIFSLSAYD